MQTRQPAEQRVIRDFILLGRAVPEELKDGRRTICSAGYSHELGFVRLYPTRYDIEWKRWDIVRARVERDRQDSREESWKLAEKEWVRNREAIERIGTYPEDERRQLLERLCIGCVGELNDNHRSLGVVKPVRSSLDPYWADNPRYGEPFQLALALRDEDPVALKRDFPSEPRVRYRCPNCRLRNAHDMQILEWGFYQWQRKNPQDKDQVWENARFNSPAHDIYFLVGNQRDRRRSFMVISVFREPKGPLQDMLPFSN